MLSAATTLHTTATGSTTTTVANAITTIAVRRTEGEDGDADTGRVERGSAGNAAEANEDAKQRTGTGRVHVHAIGSICLSPERPVCRAFDS